jgi:hypothetical protein
MEGARVSSLGQAASLQVHRERARHVARACACSKHTRAGVYKLLEDLRSQFEPCESSHRCRVGCSYSDVYPLVHNHTVPCTRYSPFDSPVGRVHGRSMNAEMWKMSGCSMRGAILGSTVHRRRDVRRQNISRGESGALRGRRKRVTFLGGLGD